MLGFILYEAVDVVYHIGKLGFNGIYYTYKYYKGDDNSNDKSYIDDTDISDKERIRKLEEKIKLLEEKIKN